MEHFFNMNKRTLWRRRESPRKNGSHVSWVERRRSELNVFDPVFGSGLLRRAKTRSNRCGEAPPIDGGRELFVGNWVTLRRSAHQPHAICHWNEHAPYIHAGVGTLCV